MIRDGVEVAVVPPVDVAAEEEEASDKLACGEEGEPGESVAVVGAVVVEEVVSSCFSLACALVF